MSNPKWIALNLVIQALDEIEVLARDQVSNFDDIAACCIRQREIFRKIGWSMKQPARSGNVDQCELARFLPSKRNSNDRLDSRRAQKNIHISPPI